MRQFPLLGRVNEEGLVGHHNCISIAAGPATRNGVPVQVGIKLSRKDSRPCLALGSDVILKFLNPGRGHSPRYIGNRLMEAVAVPIQEPYYGLTRPATIESILVRVITRNLIFGFPPLAPGLNLWPGGDGPIRPIAQRGEHKNDPKKDQLYQLMPGEWVLVIDTCGAIARVTCARGCLGVMPLSQKELIEFLTERAQQRGRRWAYDWALHNLEALRTGATNPNIELITRSVTRLNQLRCCA